MKSEHINHTFLDSVLSGEQVDSYYHLGITSDDPLIEKMLELRAVIMGGSGNRINEFAQLWSAEHEDAEIIRFPKEDRFVIRYTAGVLFVSHGMGMPSASIAVQEVMRLVYFIHRGSLDRISEVFWARVGTSGGVGVPAGTIVVTTEALMPDLKPYRVFDGGKGTTWFESSFPVETAEAILKANGEEEIPMTVGKTVATNEFFLEQFRLDGAIVLADLDRKMEWLTWLSENNVRNIEMEGAMFAGYLNYWGFRSFAMVCTTMLNRLEGDQVTATASQLQAYNERSGTVIFNYLRTII